MKKTEDFGVSCSMWQGNRDGATTVSVFNMLLTLFAHVSSAETGGADDAALSVISEDAIHRFKGPAEI